MSIFDGFPYTTAHSINLDWVLAQLKQAVTQASAANLTATETVNYVNNYFDNLDLSAETAAVLERMQNDGVLESLISAYLAPHVAEQNGKIAGQNEVVNQLVARMNTFTALPEGSTAGDAELADIRITPNGSTLSTAGEAIRKNFDNIHGLLKNSGVGECVTLSTSSGYISVGSKKPVEHDSYCYSTPIPISSGTKMQFYAKGISGTVAMIAVKRGDVYEPVVPANCSDLALYEYVAVGDCEIVFSFSKSAGYTLNVAKAQLSETVNKDNFLINKLVRGENLWSTPQIAFASSGYINILGNVVSNQSYGITEPFKLKAGHSIVVGAYGYLTNVAIISQVVTNGYKMLVQSVLNNSGTSDYLYYTYTADSDMDVVISYQIGRGFEVGVLCSPKAEKLDKVCLSLFSRFGVVGDSYASGELYYNDSYNDKYNISWGQILARKLGTVCVNFSCGGLSTRSWLDSNKGLSLMLNTEPCDIYYLALGINDCNNFGIDYLGTVADIDIADSGNNGDTFFGNYGRIISAIKSHAPNAKIVMFTIGETSDVRKSYNAAIVAIADFFGIPFIEQDGDSFFTSDFYKSNMVGGHPVAVTYSGMACGYERLLSECIVNNIDYFKNSYMY